MRLFVVLCFAVFSFAFGAFLIGNAPAERGPAAIAPIYDFSKLEDPEFKTQMKNRLVEGTKAEVKAMGVALSFGHAVGPSFTPACERYPKIKIELLADGMAVSGDSPRLEIVGPCRSAQDGSNTQALLVPFNKIYNQSPNSGPIEGLDPEMQITAVHIYGEWPTEWYVGTVKFFNPENLEDEIAVDSKAYLQKNGRPVALHW